jgi:hypothetical protein
MFGLELELIIRAVGTVVSVILTAVLWTLMRRLAPPRQQQRIMDPPPVEELEAAYGKWDMVVLALLGICGPLLAVLWQRLLQWVGEITMASWEPSHFTYAAIDPQLWWIFAIFLAIITSGVPMLWILRARLGARFDQYILYLDLRYGIDNMKVYRYMLVIGLLLFAGLTDLCLHCYVRVTDTDIAINRFWSLRETRYTYAEVDSITLANSFRAPNGNIVQRPHGIIVLKDDTRWNTRSSLSDTDSAEVERLLTFISTQSGKPIQRLARAPNNRTGSMIEESSRRTGALVSGILGACLDGSR